MAEVYLVSAVSVGVSASVTPRSREQGDGHPMRRWAALPLVFLAGMLMTCFLLVP